MLRLPLAKSKFVLTRKKQNGQVAIFVALIFQVIFVFFALLINVGLLVHHKINLQQSTDLAAYYGAMKQAEMLNAIAHVNFQIRQSWKLLAWRYRVLGTAGMQRTAAQSDPVPMLNQIDFPIHIKALPSSTNFIYNATNVVKQCTNGLGGKIGIEDAPFFCIGYGGIKGWDPTNSNSSENLCKIDCGHLNGAATTINKIPTVGNTTVPGANLAGSIDAAITKTNNNLMDRCRDLGSKDLNLLATFLKGYLNEMTARTQTIELLQANLTSGIDKVVDLEGGSVKAGIKKTFENNLTDANRNGAMSIEATTSNEKECKKFLNPIIFQFIQLYLHACSYDGTDVNSMTNVKARPTFLYKPDGSINDDSTDLDKLITPTINDDTKKLVNYLQQKFTVGFEKNPWCSVYMAVKSTSTPKIPFLPISQIKLTATAVAKPFGGSIGPWYKKTWDSGTPESAPPVLVPQTQQTDFVLPQKTLDTNPSLNTSMRFIPNFSRFVGDKEGLANVEYLANFHAAILARPLTASFYDAQSDVNNSSPIGITTPTRWPSLSLWKNSIDDTNSAYDPLAYESDSGTRLSYMRALELAAIAPNQFEATYYSIDPDFYNNYYVNLKKNFTAIANAAGLPYQVSILRPDFGASFNDSSPFKNLTDSAGFPVLEKFSVKDQIRTFTQIFGQASPSIPGPGAFSKLVDAYPSQLKKQSSLLTGWTFLNFSDYKTFPSPGPNLPNSTSSMTFGMCNNDWNKTEGTSMNELYGSPTDSVNGSLPPTPGNCVTGGRTGYSVKLVSPNIVGESAPPQNYGGEGTNGPLVNPLPAQFFSF